MISKKGGGGNDRIGQYIPLIKYIMKGTAWLDNPSYNTTFCNFEKFDFVTISDVKLRVYAMLFQHFD